MLSPKLSVDLIVQRDPDIIAAEAERDLVMVSIASGFYYGVSDVARDIWEGIECPKKVSAIIDELMATYDIDRSSCQEQTLSFLEELMTEGLVQVQHAPVD